MGSNTDGCSCGVWPCRHQRGHSEQVTTVFDELMQVIESAYQDAYGVAHGRKGYRLRHEEHAAHIQSIMLDQMTDIFSDGFIDGYNEAYDRLNPNTPPKTKD